jgi:copper(I)-binding protein
MKQFLTILIATIFVVLGCRSESNQQNKVIFGKVEFSGGWAQPGSQGQTSGVYLTISNGTASTDTLTGVSSNVASSAEIHESYEEESGTMSMRPAGEQIIPAGNKLTFEPGGLHLMLMDLKRDLAMGDTLDVMLEFARVGTKTVSVPVQIQNE